MTFSAKRGTSKPERKPLIRSKRARLHKDQNDKQPFCRRQPILRSHARLILPQCSTGVYADRSAYACVSMFRKFSFNALFTLWYNVGTAVLGVIRIWFGD
jgi:hypothetical protein